MSTASVPVLNLEGDDCLARVDPSDYVLVGNYHWLLINGYAYTKMGNRYFSMHKMIMGENPTKGLSVDHMDNDRLNNCRSNLRWATNIEQCRNRGSSRRKHHDLSGVVGVSRTRNGKYTARFKGKHGGTFSTVLQAAQRYNEMARAFDEMQGITVAKYNDLSTVE